MNTRVEERLIGIDVSDPGHKSLIQQQRFDGQLSIAKSFEKGRQVVSRGKRLQTQSPKESRQYILPFFNQEDLAKFADIPEKHCSALPEADEQVSMPVGSMLKSSLKTSNRMSPESLAIRPVRIPKGELPRHAEVENEVVAVQLKE